MTHPTQRPFSAGRSAAEYADAHPGDVHLRLHGLRKGALGRALAERIGAEIVSVDSMKIYRRMDVGTAKPSAAVRARVPHHLIDVAAPSEEFSVAR